MLLNSINDCFALGIEFYEVNKESLTKPHVYRASRKFMWFYHQYFGQYQFDHIFDLSSIGPYHKSMEKKAAEEYGIKYYDLAYIPYKDPKDSILKFLDYFKEIKNTNDTVLIHCGFGRDRVALISTIILIDIEGLKVKEAFEKSYNWQHFVVNKDHRYKISLFKEYEIYQNLLSFEEWFRIYKAPIHLTK